MVTAGVGGSDLLQGDVCMTLHGSDSGAKRFRILYGIEAIPNSIAAYYSGSHAIELSR